MIPYGMIGVDDEIFRVEPRVLLLASVRGDRLEPIDLVVFGARATIKMSDPYTLFIEAEREGSIDRWRSRILDVTIGSGHVDVLDQAYYTFLFRDVPRLTTLFLVSPLYLSHLQQSMRYVKPYGIYLPGELKSDRVVVNMLRRAFKLYYEFVSRGIPPEDARYILPLYTVTNIQTVGNARELTHLKLLSMDKGVPPITRRLVSEALSQIDERLLADRGANYDRLRYYPAPNLFNSRDEFFREYKELDGDRVILVSYSEPFRFREDELRKAILNGDESFLGLLRNNTYTFILKMSLVALHQALRQRTWNHYTECIYGALERFDISIPPSIIRLGLRDKYMDIVKSLYNHYIELRESYDESMVVGIVSHAHNVYDFIRIDGWNYISSIPLRRCIRAQWEIRMLMSDISRHISMINPRLGKYSLPSCRTLGTCPERNPCEYRDKLLSMKPLIGRLDTHPTKVG